jgi:L-cysteine S-thiosulfotransferase
MSRKTRRKSACSAGRILLLALAFFPLISEAQGSTPEQDRQALAQLLAQKFPALANADYVLGGAAFDPERRSALQTPSDRAEILAAGKLLWERKFKDGRSLGSCFPNGGRRVAATYPQYEPRTKQVVTFESAINQCLKLHGEKEIDVNDTSLAGPLLAYARGLADGQRINVRVLTAAARAKYEAGKRLFYSRMGQQNFACASCHLQYAGGFLRDQPLSAALGQTAQWPRSNGSGGMTSLQSQYRACMRRMGAEPFEIGSEALNNLEYFHSSLSNGLPLRSIPAR